MIRIRSKISGWTLGSYDSIDEAKKVIGTILPTEGHSYEIIEETEEGTKIIEEVSG